MFDTHYARDIDPIEALADPLTTPWAMLTTAADDNERIARLVEGLQVVSSVESESLVHELTRTTLAFATIVMRREDIERALREAGMPADMIRKTYAQELIDEGRAEGQRRSTLDHIIRVLSHRGIGDREAHLIAEALIEQDLATSVERAAFADLDDLTALIRAK